MSMSESVGLKFYINMISKPQNGLGGRHSYPHLIEEDN